jgi:hypothetical protein
MMAYRTYNTYALLTTVLVLVLSVLACNGSYLTTAPTTPVATVVKPITTPRQQPTTATVTATSLHVRAAPLGLRIGYLYAGNVVTLTGVCSEDPAGWAEIEWRGGEAWVNADYISGDVCEE